MCVVESSTPAVCGWQGHLSGCLLVAGHGKMVLVLQTWKIKVIGHITCGVWGDGELKSVLARVWALFRLQVFKMWFEVNYHILLFTAHYFDAT